MGTIRENAEEKMLEEQARTQYLDSIEMTRSHTDKKNKYRNLTRCLNMMRRETNDDKKIARANEPFMRQQEEIQNQELLSRELSNIRHDEILEKKLRQHLRENSHELKELETKLKAAYVTKGQMAQIAEKEAMRQRDKLQDRQAQEIMATVRYNEEQYRTKMLEDEMRHKAEYRRELQDQMIFQEQTRRFEYEEFLREKKILDDVIQRLHDEDARTIEEKMCKMKKTQQEIEKFKEAQQFWREKQKLELVEEDRKLQEYLLSKSSDAKAIRDEKARIEACKLRITETIAKKVYEVQQKRRERDDLLQELAEEEMKERLEERNKRETHKAERQKRDMYTTLTQQVAENKVKERQLAEEDERYRQQMLAKLAEDERIELMSNEKRRRKMLEVRRIVEQMIVERRQKRAEESQLELRLLAQEKEAQDKNDQLIREERIRMIEQHAQNLIGFMPRGMLSKDDIAYINAKCGWTCPERTDKKK